MQRRYYWIDISKAVLIYLVVVAHSGHISPITDTLICVMVLLPVIYVLNRFCPKLIGNK